MLRYFDISVCVKFCSITETPLKALLQMTSIVKIFSVPTKLSIQFHPV